MGKPIHWVYESRWLHLRNASGISYPCFMKIVLYSLLYLNISTILSVGRPCFQKTTSLPKINSYSLLYLNVSNILSWGKECSAKTTFPLKISLYSLLYLNVFNILRGGRPCFQKTTLALSRRDRPGRWRLFGNRAFLYTNVYRKIWYNKEYEWYKFSVI